MRYGRSASEASEERVLNRTRSHLSNVCTDSLGGSYSGRLRFPRTQEAGHGASSIINLTHFDRIAEANHFIAIFPEAFAGN